MKFAGRFGLGTMTSYLLVATVCALFCGSLRAEHYSSDTTIDGDTPLVIATGETLVFDIDAGIVVTVTRVISGEGALVKKGGGRLVLNALNTYSGGTDFHAGEIYLNQEGAVGTGPVTFKSASKSSLAFNAPDATFWNDVVFDAAAANFSDYRTPLVFDQNTVFKGNVTGPSSGTVWIGIKYSSDENPTQHQHVIIDGNLDFSKCTLGVRTFGVFTFNGWVKAKKMDCSNCWSGNGHLYFNNSENNLGDGSVILAYCPYVKCGAVNAVSNLYWKCRYNFKKTSANCMNLDGFDQVIKSVEYDPTGDPSYPFPMAPGDGEELVITTVKPATLTLTGRGANTTDCMRHAFCGGLSVTLDADPAYTLLLSNRTHRMSGTLSVSNGMLRAQNAVSFPNLKRLEVALGATMELETTAANALNSCRALGIDGTFVFSGNASQQMQHPTVRLGKDAELSLPQGCTLIVRSLIVDGQEMPYDTYAAGGRITQLKSGSIRVTPQLWPDLVEPVYTINLTADRTNRLDDISVGVIEGGVTTTVAFASLADPTAGTIRKTGGGVVISSKKLTAFTGQILIEEGGFAIDDNNETGPQNKTTAPYIWVRSGASFILKGTKSTCGDSKLKIYNAFHLAGTGLNGLGAIDDELDAYQNYTFNGSQAWVLDGDARIGGRGTQRFDISSTALNMQGHRLEMIRAPGATSSPEFYWSAITVKNPGDIDLVGYKFYPQGGNDWTGVDSTTVTVTNGSTFGYWNSTINGTEYTTLRFASGANNTWYIGGGTGESQMMTPGNVKQGWWKGPVRVDGTVRIYGAVNYKGAAIQGRLTGAGNIKMSSGWLHLYDTGNDFTGTISIERTQTSSYKSFAYGLALYANGALPLCCRSVSLADGGLALLDAKRFDLPAIVYDVSANTNADIYATASVTGGTLAGLAKTGAGTLSYKAPLVITGAVEVAEGVIDLDGRPLTAARLALGGGTIVGDVTVTEALAYAPAAVDAETGFKALVIDGKLTFTEGAKLDFDALVAEGTKIRGSGRAITVVTATGGIEGQPVVVRGSATDEAFWTCGVNGNSLFVARMPGAMIIVR